MKEMTRDLAAEEARRQASRRVTVTPSRPAPKRGELPIVNPLKPTTVVQLVLIEGKMRKRRVSK